jgi:sec-independent protein translocase protein TatC
MALVPFPQKAIKAGDPEPDWDDQDPESDDSGKMSFLEHLDELRRRIIWSVVAVGVGFGIACFFLEERTFGPIGSHGPWSFGLFKFVMGPMKALLQPGETLSYIDPTEAFALYLKLAAIAGLMLASPIVMTQVWLFIAPGLYAHEKKFAVPFVFLSSISFIGGAAFSHLVVFPMSWTFLASFTNDLMRFEPRVEPAFSLYMKMLVAFGLVFQMPPVVLFLARMGMVTSRFLIRNFKYAVLIIFIAAAILTPDGSPVTQSVMAGPMILLYLLSIALAWLFGKKRRPIED